MNLLWLVRERIGAVIGVAIASIFLCACGAVFVFYLAPRQAIRATRVANLPQMDLGYVTAADPGDTILVTGTLAENPALVEGSDLVAFELDTWTVSLPSAEDEDQNSGGDWEDAGNQAPALNVQVDGGTIDLLAADVVRFDGSLHEEIAEGAGDLTADDEGRELPDGSLRYRGFYNGDLVTVYGARASNGGVIPEVLFGGDRVAYEAEESDTARGMLTAGIGMIVCAPVLLVGGGLAAVFGRRRNRGFQF
jgi:hypothetical protein